MSKVSKSAPPLAVALHYDGKQAPRVTAKGTGDVAERIREIARRHGIPLQDNPELTRLLFRLELGETIPEALYVAVAEVIAFAYHMQGKTPSGNRESGAPS